MLISLFASLLAGILLSNVVLKGIGYEVLTQKEIRIKPVLIRSSFLSLLSLIVFLINYVIYHFLLLPLNLVSINLFVLILLVVGINEVYQLVIKKECEVLYADKYLGLNSVLLLVSLLSLGTLSFEMALVNMLGALIGFIAISVLLVIIQSKIRISPVLKGFRGLPLMLIIVGLIALIVNGLGGIF